MALFVKSAWIQDNNVQFASLQTWKDPASDPENFTVSISFEYELERLVAVFKGRYTSFVCTNLTAK